MIIKLKRLLRYIQSNKWNLIMYFVYGVVVVMICIYGYNQYMLNLVLGRSISSYEESIISKESQLNSLVNSSEYTKFSIAQDLGLKKTSTSWTQTINTLIKIFDEIKSITQNNSNIHLDDFSVDLTEIKVKGSTSDLSYMYASGGLIDSFLNLDFIDKIEIPNYQKKGELYEFNLDAKIKVNGSKH